MQFDDTGARVRPRPPLGVALTAVLMAALSLLLPPLAAAATDQTGATRSFDLPAQPLPQALQSYGEITGVAVLIDAHLLGGLRSTPVKGTLAPLPALQKLLEGTGLAPRFVDDAAFTLVPVDTAATTAAAAALPAASSGAVPKQAARVIQRSLEQALCDARATRPGSYRMVLQLWFDGDRIDRAAALQSSGDGARDNAILARLRGLAVPGLPDGLQQPVTLLLLPRGAASTAPCKGLP